MTIQGYLYLRVFQEVQLPSSNVSIRFTMSHSYDETIRQIKSDLSLSQTKGVLTEIKPQDQMQYIEILNHELSKKVSDQS